MTTDVTDLLARATAWRDIDPDPETASELDGLIQKAQSGDQQSLTDLAERFSGNLVFGTAGLRGELGAGPMRMNRVVVAHAANGLGRYLLSKNTTGDKPSVIIGFDARTQSDVFAYDTAAIFQEMGIRPLLLATHVPTPVVAFGVRHLQATAGVMVTASHNPPRDNGYKVYLGGADNGSQIIPPSDADIMREIMASHDSGVLPPMASDIDTSTQLVDEVVSAYRQNTARLIPAGNTVDLTALKVCYTPMHGVGADVFMTLCETVGFGKPITVSEQALPDPTFPTVSFPNPEEPGALDLAIQTATQHNCDLIIAHDPDADRLAVAIPDTSSENGWRVLSGNEVGVLLLSDVAERVSAQGNGGTLACSLVSTPLTEAIAQKNGLEFAATPTGFKWISRPPGLVAGFEEALGYLVNPETVRDKDGISAGLAVMFIAHRLASEGKTLANRLDDIVTTYGAFHSASLTVRYETMAASVQAMSLVRAEPEKILAPLNARTVTDYLTSPPSGFPATDLLLCEVGVGSRVIFRPSGTEPKLKVYVDTLAASTGEAKNEAAELLETLERILGGLSTGLSRS